MTAEHLRSLLERLESGEFVTLSPDECRWLRSLVCQARDAGFILGFTL